MIICKLDVIVAHFCLQLVCRERCDRAHNGGGRVGVLQENVIEYCKKFIDIKHPANVGRTDYT